MHRPCCSVGRNASFRPNLLSGASLLFSGDKVKVPTAFFQEGRKSCKAKITGSQHSSHAFSFAEKGKRAASDPGLPPRRANATHSKTLRPSAPSTPEVSTPPIFRKHTIRTACDNESPASNPVTGHISCTCLWQRLIRQRKRAYDRLKTRAMNPADDIYQSDSNFQFSPFRFPTYSVYL